MLEKRKLHIIPLCFILSFIFCSPSCGMVENIVTEFQELGIPQSARYIAGKRENCIWDMIFYDGKLFCGGGDYDKNAGPVDIWYYDPSASIWKNSGTIPEEEVNRFCLIGSALTVPGIDPQTNNNLGHFYSFEHGEWVKKSDIPGSFHVFDIVEYDGMLFAALGVNSGEYPVVYSTDNGASYSSTVFQKNGIPFYTSESRNVRVYDLFKFDERLYAALLYGENEITFDLYRYDNGIFVFDNQWYEKLHQIKFSNYIIGGKTIFSGKLFFTTGYLYETSNMNDFMRIAFPDSEIVYDLYTDNGILYALCGKLKNDGTYAVSVWKNGTGVSTDFTKIISFVYNVPPISMACSGTDFYIGMGNTQEEDAKNGTVLWIRR